MDFYTYAYLRENKTPYYIGKGRGRRAWNKNHTISVPPKDRILILKKNLTEGEAIKHEVYMIAVLGRKDLNTGMLRNRTDGGEGTSGYSRTEESKRKASDLNKGKVHSQGTREKISIAVKGFSWYNNGKINIQSRVYPGEEWMKGRILNWESPRNKGMKWYHRGKEHKLFKEHPGEGWVLGRLQETGKRYYNNGTEHVLTFECPGEGWVLGRLKRK